MTYLNHCLLVGDSPSRLLRIVIDGYDGVELSRIAIASLLGEEILMLYLRLSDKSVCTKLGIEFLHDTHRLLIRRSVFSCTSHSFFGETQ